MSDGCPTCRTFAKENNALHVEVAGLHAEILKHTNEKIALRGMVTKHRRQEEVSRHVMAVARMWKALCSPTAAIKPTGKNVEYIRTAFNNYCEGDLKQRRHLLYDCIRGYALRPYDAGFARRTANPAGILGPKGWSGAKRKVKAEYIFHSEERIEDGAAYYRFVQAQPVEWKHAVWRAASATESAWQLVWFAAAMARDKEDAARLDRLYGLEHMKPPEDHAAHLLLDEPAVVPEVAETEPRLFVIEGGREAA